MFGLCLLLAIVAPIGAYVYCTRDWFDDVVWKVVCYSVLGLIIYYLIEMII